MASPDRVESGSPRGVSGGSDGGGVVLGQPARQAAGASSGERWPPAADGQAVARVHAGQAERHHAGQRSDERRVTTRSLAEPDSSRQRHERRGHTVRIIGQPSYKSAANQIPAWADNGEPELLTIRVVQIMSECVDNFVCPGEDFE